MSEDNPSVTDELLAMIKRDIPIWKKEIRVAGRKLAGALNLIDMAGDRGRAKFPREELIEAERFAFGHKRHTRAAAPKQEEPSK